MRIHELVAEHMRRRAELFELAILGIAATHGLTIDDVRTRMVREERGEVWAFGGRSTLTLDGLPVFWTWYEMDGPMFTLCYAWPERAQSGDQSGEEPGGR